MFSIGKSIASNLGHVNPPDVHLKGLDNRVTTDDHDAIVEAKSQIGDTVHTSQFPHQSIGLSRRVSGFIALTKPRIIELLLVTTLPTMFVAKQGVPALSLMLETLLGGALAAGGANAINMVVDRDIDSVMKRTKSRPLVTGVVTATQAMVFAIVLETVAFVELYQLVNLLSAILAVSATAFYVFVYTIWLKRTSTQNIVIGGAAGAVPVLVGWAAVTNSINIAPIVLFSIVFLWTPPHFWALAVKYSDDYKSANVPMLPAVTSFKATARQIMVYTLALWACSLVFGLAGHMGIVYFVSALLLGAVFVLYAAGLLKEPSEKRAMATFHYSITYLTLLFVSMGVDVLVRHGG